MAPAAIRTALVLQNSEKVKMARRVRAAVELPRHVHHVVARGREYFYYQVGRGTKHAGPRTKLPNDPHSPGFWQALRQLQGISDGAVPTDTVGALIDAFEADWPKLRRKIAESTQDQYRRQFRRARKMWGALGASGLRPSHVQQAMEKLADTPGAANNFLGAMQALSKWGRAKGLLDFPLTDGVEAFQTDGGHQPWSDEQVKVAHDYLTGMIRRGVMLLLYTGQRGSDMVRLGPTMIDDGGIDLGPRGQQKTGERPWCPILPELAKEMESWDKQPGPFVRNKEGGKCTRARFNAFFNEAKAELAAKGITALEDATLHGLRATACIRLKREGFADSVISDMVGMSICMVQRYTRFEDKRATGKSVLAVLATRKLGTANDLATSDAANCKTLENVKPKLLK
jgi:integrase